MSKYIGIFRSESEKNIQEMSDSLLALEQNPENAEQMNILFRSAHTFKGMAATMGFKQIVELTHEMESLIDRSRTGKLTLDSYLIDILFECLDTLERLVEEVCAGMENKIAGREGDRSEGSNSGPDAEKILETLRTINNPSEEYILQKNEFCTFSLDKRIEEKRERQEVKEKTGEKTEEKAEEKEKGEKEETQKTEGREKEETQKTKEGEKGEKIEEREKGEKTEEDEERERKNAEKEEKEKAGEKEKEEETEGREKNEKERQSGKEVKTQSPKIHSSRVSTEKLDKLMNLVGELVINRSRVKELTGKLKSKDLDFALSDYQKLTRELQEEVLEIRMIPLDHITNIFPRMIRDLARGQNKKIDFIIRGKEIKIDRAIIEEIGDPLVHLLRNAVDHGIETPEKRVELGKEETGKIIITASRQQNYVLIRIEDDGKGIDAEEIRKIAFQRRLISRDEAEQLSERELIQLIFTPGLSTASEVTDLSGRGIGMDIVKNRIEHLGGSIKVDSKPGTGSRFELRLPITIALCQSMLVKVGMERYAIPFTNIIKSISVRKKDVRHIRGEEVILINEKTLPLLRLRKLFQLPAIENEENLDIVIVEKAGQYIGLVVDSLLGKQEIIIKTFKSRLLEKTRGFAGATVMGDGSVILILDINSIT
ncbi:Signal transduction histidine kinase CheA [Methanosarcina mazei SarPi]|uniref:Chemotaxis protein CheA n=2 Tax=Methanosarcina mazei TaxID=2209 RepID=A0A0E3LTA6_METMZ|nr:Signal transduction histidine kinase CheA [Methanosarcina mazei SarPi]